MPRAGHAERVVTRVLVAQAIGAVWIAGRAILGLVRVVGTVTDSVAALTGRDAVARCAFPRVRSTVVCGAILLVRIVATIVVVICFRIFDVYLIFV